MKLFFPASVAPKVNLFFIGVFVKVIASALSAIGFVLKSPVYSVSSTMAWLAFFIILLVVALPDADSKLAGWQHWLRPTATVITIVFCIVGIALLVLALTIGLGRLSSYDRGSDFSRLMDSLNGVFGYNDATALSHQAAENFLEGKNPYAEANIVTAGLRFHGSTEKLTPLREGMFTEAFPYPTPQELERLWQEAVKDPSRIPPELESKFNYPAGSFLLLAPFLWLGLSDLRLIYLIVLLPVLFYVAVKIPRDFRLTFIAALIASLELWNSLAAGETGFGYFPFLLLGWLFYPQHFLASAILMAVAVSTKQITWFLLPFYLLLILRTMGFRRALLASFVIAAVFVVANGWFFARDPGLWITSILAPVRDKMFPLGVGIITLVTSGLVDIRSPLPFTIAEFGVFALALLWYYFSCRRYPHTALVLSVLPLFFAWRSLWGYFFYVDIILLSAVLVGEYAQTRTTVAAKTAEDYFQVHQVLRR